MRVPGKLGLLAVVIVVCSLAGKMYGKDAEAAKNSEPIYVGGYSVDHEYNIVTDECLKILSTKKILYGSRSWGLVIGSYVSR